MLLPSGARLPDLPVRAVIGDVLQGLESGREVVLAAPPGAGKTTLVPLALLGAPWRRDGRIMVLEPRRLAARAAAHRMAWLLGETVGETVGYRIRMEQRVGPKTRIEVITEGILTRMVQADPELRGTACVIFDEFHERSLHADLSLALVQDARQALRPDLRLVLMSATLDVDDVASALPSPSVVQSDGRQFPVTTHHVDASVTGASSREVAEMAVSAVRRALSETEGSILVFLPGQAEIRYAFELLGGDAMPGGASSPGSQVTVHMLFGSLPFDEQKRALEPAPAGERKVVLATDLAESSLTVDGVTVVVDTGVRRLPIYNVETGLTRLATRPISQASAAQRRGRAGRTAPGVCYRLWSRLEDSHRRPFDPPEILTADLTPLVLDVACWGARDVATLRWVTVPPSDAVATSRALLTLLGALDSDGNATPLGRAMARLGAHPRLARMILAAASADHSNTSGAISTACAIAALLEEGDILRQGPSVGADLRLRLDTLGVTNTPAGTRHAPGSHGASRGASHGALGRVRRLQKEFERKARAAARELGRIVPHAGQSTETVGQLIALAWPDGVAQRVDDADVPATTRSADVSGSGERRYRLRSGRIARLRDTDPLATHAFLAVAETGGRGTTPWIFLAAPISQQAVEELFAADIRHETRYAFNADAARVEVAEERVLGALVLLSAPAADADPDETARVLTRAISQAGLHVLPWDKDAEQLRDRIQFLRARDANSARDADRARGGAHTPVADYPPDGKNTWPARLAENANEWLLPHVRGMRRFADLRKINLKEALLTGLSWERRQELDRRAPPRLDVPSGSSIRIDYSDAAAPVLAVRLQEVFGLTHTPTVDDGRVPLVMHLLSPAHRPVQVTTDLKGFWEGSYSDVRKDMRGRYPKHIWPENPLEAQPTSRTTKRSARRRPD